MDIASTDAAADEPLLRYTLWPHRSMSMRGFRLFMLASCLLATVPLYGVVGTAALMFVGAFVLIDQLLLFGLISLTYRTGRLREVVELWPDRLRIERIEPNGQRKCWEANPHWVRIELHNTRQISNYLVLSSAGKDVELGAFLTPSERRDLAAELRSAIVRLNASAEE